MNRGRDRARQGPDLNLHRRSRRLWSRGLGHYSQPMALRYTSLCLGRQAIRFAVRTGALAGSPESCCGDNCASSWHCLVVLLARLLYALRAGASSSGPRCQAWFCTYHPHRGSGLPRYRTIGYHPTVWLHIPSNSAPDTAASASPCDWPECDPELWVTLSGTPTRRPLSWRGWKTRPWIRLLSGTISTPSQAGHTAVEWIWSVPVSRASRGRLPVSVVELTTIAGSGPRSPGSSVRWDRLSSSWRTSPDSTGNTEDLPSSSRILPTSGSMRSGVCSPQPALAHRTSVSGSGFWPSPRAMGGFVTPGPTYNTQTSHGMELGRLARMWPTPRASLGMRGSNKPHGAGGIDLDVAAGLQAQKTSVDGRPTGDLNPSFVEALMGLPDGWSDPLASVTGFTSWVTAWSRRPQPKPSSNWQSELVS